MKRCIVFTLFGGLLSTMGFGEPVAAKTSRTKSTHDFAECRALLQAYAGALSRKLATYQVNTPERLESTFRSEDGAIFTITCVASERLMIITEEK